MVQFLRLSEADLGVCKVICRRDLIRQWFFLDLHRLILVVVDSLQFVVHFVLYEFLLIFLLVAFCSPLFVRLQQKLIALGTVQQHFLFERMLVLGGSLALIVLREGIPLQLPLINLQFFVAFERRLFNHVLYHLFFNDDLLYERYLYFPDDLFLDVDGDFDNLLDPLGAGVIRSLHPARFLGLILSIVIAVALHVVVYFELTFFGL